MIIATVDSINTTNLTKQLDNGSTTLSINESFAGYIIYRQLAELHYTNEYLILLPKNNFWTIPKGVIPSGENATGAANRLLNEKTNLTRYHLDPITEFGSVVQLLDFNNNTANITILGGKMSNPLLPIAIPVETYEDYQWIHLDIAYSTVDEISRKVFDAVKYFTWNAAT